MTTQCHQIYVFSYIMLDAAQPYTEIQAIGCGVGILTIWN